MGRLLILFLSVFTAALADVGKVVGVYDRDTLTILLDSKESVKVRLFGIGAPELGQAFGSSAREALSGLTLGKRAEFSGEQKDQYGRTVSKMMTPEGEDAGLEMISSGMAWHYALYANKEKGHAQAEERARDAKLGLWNEKDPVSPWGWRKNEQQK